MEKNLHHLFKKATYLPEGRLSGDIWSAIESRNAKFTKVKTFGYLIVSLVSLFGSIISIKNLIGESIKLGFYNYLSLIFSDGGILAQYWKDYTLSLIDSLPVASLVFSLALLFVLFTSIRRISYQLKITY